MLGALYISLIIIAIIGFIVALCLPSKVRGNETLYAITVIFNPNNFKSRYTLYREFKKYMAYCGVKLITVEIAYKDRPFVVTTDNDLWALQLRTEDELWHKEAAINAGFKYLLKLVPSAKYVAWLDADIKFSNPNWPQDTITALQRYCIVQPFSEAHNLNSRHESMWKTPSSLKYYQDKLGYHKHPPHPTRYLCGGHPGLAWAARVETLKAIGGLPDFCIAGSGDTHLLNALVGDVTMFYRVKLESKIGWTLMPEFLKKLQQIAAKIDKHVNRNIGYVHGICFHYWHGKSVDRGYEKRWDIINFHKFDPTKDITLEPNGLYKWTGNKPNLAYDLRKSLSSRNEDTVE